MYLVRRAFRWSFSLTGFFFLRLALLTFARNKDPRLPAAGAIEQLLPVIFGGLFLVFAMAWWSMRRGNNQPHHTKTWALIACAINILYGAITVFLRYHFLRDRFNIVNSGTFLFLIGCGGLYLFCPEKLKARFSGVAKAPVDPLEVDLTTARPGPAQQGTAPLAQPIVAPTKAAAKPNPITSLLEPLQSLLKPKPPTLKNATRLIASALDTPTRPRDFDINLLQSAIEACPPDASSLQFRIALAHAFEDRGELTHARTTAITTEHFIRQHGLEVTPAMLAGFVIETAFYRHDARSTGASFQRLQQQKPEPLTVDYYLAEACTRWLNQSLDEANIAWRQARDLATTRPACGATAFDLDRIARLRTELDQAAAELTHAEHLEAAPAWLAGSFAQLNPIHTEPAPKPVAIVFAPPAAAPLPELEVPDETVTFHPIAYPNDRRKVPRTGENAGRKMWPRPENA